MTSDDQTQRRAGRIEAFREDLAELEREGVLALSDEQQAGVWRRLAETLDLLGGTQLSWPIRIVSAAVGLLIWAAFYQLLEWYWGALATPLQVAILVAAPLGAVWLTGFAARRERTLHLASLAAIAAFACFVVDWNVVESTFNLTPAPHRYLMWAAFALVLAYAARMRLLLAAGLVCALIWMTAEFATLGGLDWADSHDRAENLMAAGLLVLAVPALCPHRGMREFPPVYRLTGVLAAAYALLLAALGGSMSYLPLPPKEAAGCYQLVWLAASAATALDGIVWRRPPIAYLGATSFAVMLWFRLRAPLPPEFIAPWFESGILGLLLGGMLVPVFRNSRRATSLGRWGLPAAMGVVLAGNAWLLAAAAFNRSQVVQRIELTERELWNPNSMVDYTSVSVGFSSWPVWEIGVPRDESADLAKVAELGFDWHVERGDPSAKWRAERLPKRRAFVVIEYDGPAWQARLAGVEKSSKEMGSDLAENGSRLETIDAGPDPATLRRKYADPKRYLIVPALVGTSLDYDQRSGGKWLSITLPWSVLVDRIHVPQPYARWLGELRRSGGNCLPRYVLTLCYGRRYEPWICGCRQP